ncbi:DUF1990 family protein [Nocardioides sp. URHA0020]|uniref:DUF1990 family protein n=1 Tax=Nocardioides sp. URHA0020 TaxID=1380392 RepID=UPI000A3FFE15|nr:DUF1990 domain-containing protein [Nocardioides sp. URHA0020]
MHRLASARATALGAATLTYDEVGATRGDLPAGYRPAHRRRVLERRDFDGAVDDLVRWRVHERAGLWVAASGPAAGPGVIVDMRLGVGPVAVRVPCRVVYVVSEPDRAGFAYGTLPGHPESGEELFLLARMGDGRVVFTITAFSRPGTRLTRLGGPVARGIQGRITDRYLRAAEAAGSDDR